MPLMNCEINLILTWPARCQEPIFTITDTKIYVPVVTLSTQGNVKLLQQLKSGFKRTINSNKVTVQQQNWYLNFSLNPCFQGINSFFVLSFQNNGGRTRINILSNNFTCY